MNEKALRILEFNKITAMLAGKAVSVAGKELAARLTPGHDLTDIETWQRETGEAAALILKKGSLPLGGIKDVGASIRRAGVGGVLSIEELLHVGDFLYVSRKVKDYYDNDNRGAEALYNTLGPYFAQVLVINPLEKEIARCIISQTDVADDASAALYDVRRNIKVSNERVKEHLNGVLHSQAYKDMLQDYVVTIRAGRYCVPVKAEFRAAFPGVVHDQSSSGATLFMEPMSVVQLNNRIKELAAQESVEIDKILGRLSGLVAEHADALLTNADVLTRLDFAFAKGELAIAMNATQPRFNANGAVNIKKGRHPLLNPQTVVPTDIYIGGEFRTLLITGPNTGGKTVSLKTLGLLSLMGQAGLHIPAFDNSELNLFDDIFADIGDEQSIEQSLSTFSSHMSNIVGILESVSENCLVLLDELGAGTDPTEGAALAIAILQHLHGRGALTAVTTHYSELKVYALSAEGVENACCEFDVATLRPTYRLLIGVPGKSNAFAISQRLGLPEPIIDAAKETISAESARFEDVITDLEIGRKTALMERDRAEAYRREAEKLHTELEAQKAKLAASREKILLAAREEALRITQQAKDEADGLVKRLHKELREGSHKDAEATRQSLRDNLAGRAEAVAGSIAPGRERRPAPAQLRRGDGVFIHSLNRTGVVSSPPDAGGEVLVTAGIMKVKVPLSDLSLDDSEETVTVNARAPGKAAVKGSKSLNISPELDLRGHMSAEAVEKTDKYIDDAYLSSLGQVAIIHGKGTGALRAAVQSHLRGHPLVKSFRLGGFGEGDSGVTIVELKKD